MESAAESVTKPLGVIDSLQGGFELVTRRPWLLILPILVDLFLWLGPRLSLAPLIDRMVDLALSQPDLPTEFVDSAPLVRETMSALGASYNLMGLLAGAIIRFPSFLARLDASSNIAPVMPVQEIESFQTVVLYALVLIPIGLLIGSIWLATIVRQLDTEAFSLWDTVRRCGWIWVNSGLYLAGLIVLTMALGGILLLFAGMVMLIAGTGSLVLINLIWLLLLWGVFWASIGLTFVISAVALDGVNVARAVWRSINVVGRNLSSTIGLLLIAFVLTEGFARIWLLFSGSNWGVPVGIVGSAYIGGALTVAGLIFYRARYQHWQRVRLSMSKSHQQSQNS